MKLFITGVTGYIGHKLAMAAVKKGYKVNALIRNEDDPKRPIHPSINFFRGDITNFDSLIDAMKGCDAVIHAAGLTQLWNKDRSLFYKVNVGGTRNMLEAALHHNVKKFVFTSSCAVLGPSFNKPVKEDDPRLSAFENDYKISKHCAEELVKEYSRKGLFTIIVSPPRIYGPGMLTKGNPITRFVAKLIKRRVSLIPSAHDAVGNYAYADDVVEGHFLAMQKGLGGEKYILGGENISYQTFFNTIRECSGKKLGLIAVPKMVLKIGAALIYASHYITGRHTHLSPKIVDRLFQNRAVSCEKAIRQLGYKITPFREGMHQTIQHLKTV